MSLWQGIGVTIAVLVGLIILHDLLQKKRPILHISR